MQAACHTLPVVRMSTEYVSDALTLAPVQCSTGRENPLECFRLPTLKM
jgi:hypothetical protein